ncbi:restriction endonuclease [Algoriphagus marincola]|uniref:Restriction endonuclease n=1 Tax=Algoriphagus marincola TaxID=264027 RepID=A0ABS7N5I7_9BACT|nr:restriction endonuclease [Algoriphagus marincola]MBY5951602.1 restriction endonuclease [Algoriphagus marincola]
MNYWLHRISHIAELSYPLLDKGFLTIGFSDFTQNEFIDKVLENDRNYFDEQFRKEWGEVPRRRHNLWRFLKFNKGDIVIVPSWGTFLVCEIIDEKPLLISETYTNDLKTWGDKKVSTDGTYLISENGKERYDLGFARKVKILHKNISRAKYADAKLTSRMKIRQTNGSIDDLKKNIEKSIAYYIENRPIHLHSIIVEKTANLVLDAIKTELNSDKFEKLVRTYFNTIGANEVTIPAKNERDKEGDADIVAVFENIKLIIYTQAKFHEGKINEWGTNQILDYKTNRESIDDGYNKIAWVITSADTFDEKAEKIATENEIQLINGLEFSKMLLNAGINLLNNNM